MIEAPIRDHSCARKQRRNLMQRASNVRTQPRKPAPKRNPPARAEGSRKQSVAVACEQHGFSSPFRSVLQARDLIDALRRLDARIAEGERVEERGTEGIRRFYAACWRIYAACSDERDRMAFETLTGESWARFEGMLDCLAFRLLPRHRSRENPAAPGRVISPEELGHA